MSYNVQQMHIILTHEQADFDALAALFGASLADEPGLPVLPRRLNRNARAFITLYGADFLFADPHDLPQEPVESVTLVDTQSLVTVKGMGKRTPIRVIDHHARRESTPAGWDLTVLETGATTTYFVEVLEGRDETLSAVQATLLLLGIYEDTGSLTYSHTTPRDIRAAAWLLEVGASLQLAAPYLNPPLSPDQRSAYDALVNAAETREIDGLRVVITKADLPGLTDEISSLAHKLRDLFDPDALFVLVQTTEGVRMVARSMTDRVDVSAVAAHFGGGGHERAASALIKRDTPLPDGRVLVKAESPLEQTCALLLGILPQHIRPAVTVSQLMSRKPRTLDPETTVQEAASLMQRYGYEGFPVVRDGRVVGLLTRRAVDRAIGHHLNLTAASLMDAGELSLHPADSLQRLQSVMVDTGWGQVPVTDEGGTVIGIVTRTDLLKVLAPASAQSGRRFLGDRLEKELPAPQRALLHAVDVQASELHLPVYVVGGFVRDLLLGRLSLDFDIVIEGDAIALAKSLATKHGGRVTTHDRFGTAKWYLDGSRLTDSQAPQSQLPAFLDLIAARLEFYERPAALPGVEHGSIRHDLHRRDFTINTLALRLDGHHFGELHDYYGGQADLQRGLVRVLHSLSFVDDPTRMLRAVRYEQRYGFRIEPRTMQLMDEARPLIARLSAERLRHELDLIFAEPRAPAMLARLDELNLLQAIADAAPWSAELRSRLETWLGGLPPLEWGLEPPSSTVSLNQALGYALWLQDLTVGQVDAVQSRLGFPLALDKIVRAASALKAHLSSGAVASPSGWTFYLDELPLAAVYAVFQALRSSAEPSTEERRARLARALEDYALHWRHIHTQINGDTLRDLGLPPGPRFQSILNHLRAAWLDGEISTPAQEDALLKELISAEYGSSPVTK